MRLTIKYCGGCNPLINRRRIAEKVINNLQTVCKVELVQNEADVILVICGCPAACVDLDNIKNKCGKLILVSGNGVNYLQIPRDRMTEYICQIIWDNKL